MNRNIKGKTGRLPLRLPKHSRLIDLNDPKPGGDDFFEARGIFHLGNDDENYELWLADADVKTHMLIYGTTGSGKSAALQSIAYNAFVMGTGLCYIDAKGEPSLSHNLFKMTRRVSREDDFLDLNFLTGGVKIDDRAPYRGSNTFNPLAAAPADAVTTLLMSLLPKEDGGGNSVFQQKAVTLLTAIIPVLCALRDAGVALPLTDMSKVKGISRAKGSLGTGLSVSIVRDYLEPAAAVSLVHMLKKDGSPEECAEVAKHVPKPLLDALKAALASLNYVDGGGEVQDQQAYLDQFGYAKCYFGAPLASISEMYKSVFDTQAGEVEMHDVLFNRRILSAILPALEKTPQECENLGKIVLASVKNSVSGGLGTRSGKSAEAAIASSISDSQTPGIIIIDGYAAIMMPGFEVILTQARSLGFMAIIASQSYEGMKGKDERSCGQIVENTKTKLFMKMTQAGETWDLAKSLFGTITVEEADLSKPEDHGVLKEIAKVSHADLMNQIEGEFHAWFQGQIIRGRIPNLIPKPAGNEKMRINRFIRTDISPEKVRKNLERKGKE